MLDNFESISATAILTSYPRMFTDIPYESKIYEWLKKNGKENMALDKMLAPEIEARYKLTNRLLEKSKIKQVLELAAGYSSRGIIYAKKGYNYIEMDLEGVSKNKKKIINYIGEEIKNLHIVNGNALYRKDYDKCEKYFNKNEEVAIINEGLLRYLTFEEKKAVAKNIYNVLKKYNGIWITCDVTPKKFIQKQENYLPQFNTNLSKITSRNNLKDRFEDINHIKEFFGDIGFKSIQVHKFIEIKEFLSSFSILNIPKNRMDEVLEEAIIAIMKIE